MIKSLFILCFGIILYSQESIAQVTTPTLSGSSTLDDPNKRLSDEQRINDTLTNQDIQSGGGVDKTYVPSTSSAVTNQKEQNTDNLSDAEKQVSENYIHQGLSKRQMDEECQGDNYEVCYGMEAKTKFLGIDGNLIKALSKAYSMVIGAGAIGGKFKKGGFFNKGKTDAAKTGTDAKADKDEGLNDYCKYIAVATEVIATFQQQNVQNDLNSLPTNAETAQKDMLYRSARSHSERADNAKIQRNGWGVTAVCYTAYLGFAQIDWNLGLKLAASYLMTAFFQSEIKAHEDAANKARAIADALPGRGDCNPVTDKDCYCAQPETQNDPNYCLKGLHTNSIASTAIRTTCVDSSLKADPACNCMNTRTCFDQQFLKVTKLNGLPASVSKNVGSQIAGFTNGQLSSGSLSSTGLQTQSAIAKKLRDLNKKLPKKKIKLNPAQTKEALSMSKLGIPPRLAAALANAPANTPEAQKFAAGLKSGGQLHLQNLDSYKQNKGSQSIYNYRKRRRSSRKKSKNNYAKKFMKKKRTPGSQVRNYAEKAAKKAAINTDKDRPIFDIISRRYQLTAKRRLELE
ncbi:MAG: hypothetical protein ACPGJV_06425 [Bacteriovoracaceae bacterium]